MATRGARSATAAVAPTTKNATDSTKGTDMTETETAPIHWSAIEPGADDEGCSEVRTRGQMVTHFAAMAQAHSEAFRKCGSRADGRTREALRSAIDNHLHPMIAAFTAAAALRGWVPDQIEATTENAQAMDELCWQWLTEAGVAEDQIRRLTADLNAPDVVTSLA